MTHIQLQNKFAKKLSQYLDEYFYYKIPDTGGLGNLRPFDSILLFRGTLFAIELKIGRDKIKKHQKYFLDKITRNKGVSLIITDKDDINKLIVSKILEGEHQCWF